MALRENYAPTTNRFNFTSLNAPKIAFCSQKVRFSAVLKFKKGAFRDEVPNQTSEHAGPIPML